MERKTGKIVSIGERLRHNPGALAGIIIIGASVLVSLFAYLIAPDHSPYANRITVEIGGKPPGYAQLFLLLRHEQAPSHRTGILRRLADGASDSCSYLPVTAWRIQGDSILVDKYVDDGVTERQSYPLARINPYRLPMACYLYRERFWLGTDRFGRDILSRLLIGTRISLSVGLVAVAISLSIGIALGALAGYYRGRLDEGILWFMNIVWSIPTLLLVFAITLAIGKGFWQVFIAVGLTLWVNVARTLRGQVLAIRELEYIEAARALGFRDIRIITRHILPGVIGPVMVVAASNFATAIVIEAGLSFLGVGVQPPQPSWGLMIKENYSFIITHNPMLAIVPGIAIMLLVLAFNLLGNGLRDALDVRRV
jgi:ABC-type dipeptide/oligopeptide/nickel transport system permease subunit